MTSPLSYVVYIDFMKGDNICCYIIYHILYFKEGVLTSVFAHSL